MAPRVPRPTKSGHKQGQGSAPATAAVGKVPSTVSAGIAPAPAPKHAPASMLAAPTDSEMTLEGWVDCRCLLSFVFVGVARRLELSPCNTRG